MSQVGKDIPHDSAVGHVNGQSVYIDDMPPIKNELLVDFYYAPVSHAKIRKLDLSDAEKIPGVVGLYTYRDLDGENKFGPILKDEVLLVEEEIEFMGHPIVVIAAENRKAIESAKKAIKIDLEKLEPILTIDQAKERKMFIGPVRRIKKGDAEAALKKAEHVIEGRFCNAGQDHFYLESQAALVYPGEHKQLVIHSSTQNPTEVQEVVAHLLGLSMNQVVCITKRMGGGFGGKECQAGHPAAMAALVALKTGRAARIIFNKDQDMQVTGKRHPFQNDYKVGFDKDGRITALKADLFSDGGAANDLSTAVMARAMTHTDNAYYLENAEITGTICKTHFPPNTAFRGFGGPQGIAIIENIIEEIATYLGKDAIEIRKINLYGINERNVTPYGQRILENSLPEIFEKLEVSSDYKAKRKAVEKFNSQSKTHLKGLACTAVKFGISFNTKFLNQANALVNIYTDGTIQVSTGATEMGQGVNTNIKQLVAGEFDIDVDHVIVMATSTEKNNNTSATAASSATDLNGSAAVNACQKLKARLTDVAARHIETLEKDILASPTNIIFENNFVYDNRRPDTKVAFKTLVKKAYHERVSLGERGFYATQGIDFSWDTGPEGTAAGQPFLYFTTGAAVCEVTIDRFTGELKVDSADILMDVGAPINPGIAKGQITGAFIQGMGWVTTEELRYADDGLLVSHSPTTYKIPNIQDIPKVLNVNWIDKVNPVNVKGSKAVGEPPLVLGLAVWAAVKNALAYVSGGEIAKLHLPASNEEILTRLHQFLTAGSKKELAHKH
ncbi:MAG: xanthine dehydrogenase molybdopterin binding subunit [Candidatus Obscuribacterales bacterium]|nr:xanthine dehydrogenase molybdopterin binding subunit [Candidatus Obscuribacterales bacterium]